MSIKYEELTNAQNKVEPMTTKISAMKEETDNADTMDCNGTTMSNRSTDLDNINTDANAVNDWSIDAIKGLETLIKTGSSGE